MIDRQNELDLDDDLESKDPYLYFMMKEPHLNKTPIKIDSETGWRYTYRDIGMTRNASNTKEMKVYLDPMPHVILNQKISLRGWYKNKFESKGVRPRPCDTDALLTQPYGGFCHVGCGFCYINNGIRGYRGQGITTVDPNYGQKIRKQISKMRTGQAVYMSSFIDPFLELENAYHNTQDTSQAAIDAGLPIFFLTRKEVPAWAYDHLKINKYSYMQFSINTSNPDIWKRLSPRAASLDIMLAQVKEMHKRKIYVSIQVNPIVPGIVDNDDIVRLIHILAKQGANHLIFKFVEIVYPSVPGLLMQMKKRFGRMGSQAASGMDKYKEFEELFTCNIGGVKTIDEEYRKNALDIYSKECKKAKVTMSVCYEYEYEKDKQGNILNKTGVSMGAKYLTGDQCHGHRVPVFSRPTTDVLFEPIEVCPSSGCLTCGNTKTGGLRAHVPCGNDFLKHAPAWEAADLNKIAWTKKHDKKKENEQRKIYIPIKVEKK